LENKVPIYSLYKKKLSSQQGTKDSFLHRKVYRKFEGRRARSIVALGVCVLSADGER